MSIISDAIDDYYQARAHYDECRAMSNEADRARRKAEAKVVDAMLDESCEGMKRNDGTSIALRQQFSLSVTVDNQDMIRGWLVETEGDDAPFVEEKVNKEALIELVKARIHQSEVPEEDFPDFLNVSTRPGLSVRGWKTRTKQ